ncbi:hypothetical protein BS17DRAFT_543724 [Gyrodon lividus]|nr:hypothetical protein BS17DRAFT_543724 [Gyrodon lividus]
MSGPGVSQPAHSTLVSTEHISIFPSLVHLGNFVKDKADSPQSPETLLVTQPRSDSQAPPFSREALHSSDETSIKPTPASACGALLDAVRDSSHSILADNDNDNGKKGTAEDFQVTPYCFSCRKFFKSNDDLRSHLCSSRHTLQPHCSFCYTQFDDELSLRQHLDDSRLSFSCHLCHTLCCSNGMLKEHINGHPTCRRCMASFINDQDLCKHMMWKHPTVVCWDCDAVIVEQDSLELHYTDSPDHPTCAFCGVGMKNVNAMDEHVHTHHAGERLAVPGDQFAVSDNVIARSDEFPQTLSTEHVCDKPSSSRQDEDGRFTSPLLVSSEHGSKEGLSQLASHQSIAQSAPTASFGSIVSTSATPSVVTAELPTSSTSTDTYRLHCRICQQDPCEDMTATICGHIFCKKCITQAVVANSECPVCKSVTLLYYLFKLQV